MCNVMVEETSTPASDYSRVKSIENMGGPGYTYKATHQSEWQQRIQINCTYVATNLYC